MVSLAFIIIIDHINELAIYQAELVLRWVTVLQSHPGQLNLVIR